MNKYVAKRLTLTSWTQVPGKPYDLPYITLCPGYKPSMYDSIVLNKRGLSNAYYPHVTVSKGFNDSYFATRDEVNSWWRKQTYDLDEGLELHIVRIIAISMFYYVYFLQ